MAQPAERREVRLSLSHVDRGVQLEKALVLSRHPSEALERVVLRVLAFCLLANEELAPAPGGVSEGGDAPDLLARDPTGELTVWVRCGSADPEQVRKIINHNPKSAVHLVFSRLDRQQAFLEEASHRTVRGWDRVAVWLVDRALVQALAAHEETRQRWTVTVVGDHLYVDNGHGSFDGDASRT